MRRTSVLKGGELKHGHRRVNLTQTFSHNAAKAACFQTIRSDSFRFNSTSKKEIEYAYFGMPRALRRPIWRF